MRLEEVRMLLPEGLEAYRRTPVFTQDTVPSGLLKAHQTKAGVWGLLHVIEGRLLYRDIEAQTETVLEPGDEPGVIQPEIRHEVAPLGSVRFFIEFHRAPET